MKKSFRINIVFVCVAVLSAILTSCGEAQENKQTTAAQNVGNSTVQAAAEKDFTQPQETQVSTAMPEETSADGAGEVSGNTEYRLDCEKNSFSAGESFTVVLSMNCYDFCMGCCYISFDSALLSCTDIVLSETDNAVGMYNDENAENGLAVISLYTANPIDMDYLRVAEITFTVKDDAEEDTESEISFTDGTLCHVAENENGTQLSDISSELQLSGLRFSIS